MDRPERFDRLNDEAKEALRLAQEEAQRFGHNYIGTEHLLLGLIRQEASLAAQVLQSLGVELEKVRSAVEFIIGRGDRLVMREIGLTPRTKKVIELAIDEAQRMNSKEVGPEHLLLGLVREGEGIAAGVLESLSVNLQRVRRATLEALGLPVPEAPPEPARPVPMLDAIPALSMVGAFPLSAALARPPGTWAFTRYRFFHIDAEQPELRSVGNGANPTPIPTAPYSAVLGTRLGWVVVNTGGAFTLRLYDGFIDAEPFAVITNPPTGASFPYHYVVKQGLTYTLEGAPGSVTILYSEIQA